MVVFYKTIRFFFGKNVKNGFKNGVLSKKVPFFYPFFGTMRLTFFFCQFWSIFLFLQEIWFFQLPFLQNNSIFLKKRKNEFKIESFVFPQKLKKLFVFFWKNIFLFKHYWILFIFLAILICSRSWAHNVIFEWVSFILWRLECKETSKRW